MAHPYAIGLAALVGCLAANAFGQGSIFVNGAAGDDAWDGRCEVWNGGTCGPKATIQAGIDAAAAGDAVLIADGVYTGFGNRDLDFHGQAITVRSAGGDPATCIIDCERLGRGFAFQNGETTTSVVQGLTIRHGVAEQGGGIFCFESSPILRQCMIVHNTAEVGGGVFCIGSGALVEACDITANVGSIHGGGVCCVYELPGTDISPMLRNCRINGNSSGRAGGGLYCEGANLSVTNCTIADNSAPADWSSGGGVYCDASDVRLTNCIIWSNLPHQIDVFWSGEPAVRYCDVQGGWAGTGNIDIDPGFAFPSDGHLLPGSPCIDAGTGDPPGGLPAQDLEGRPRPIDGDGDGVAAPDMGAYELEPALPAIALSDAALTISVPQGQTASRTLSVCNAGLGTLNWALECQTEWLSATPVAGESDGEVDVITLTFAAQTLAPKQYNTVLWVSDPQASNSRRAVLIVLYVTSELHVPGEHATIQAAIDAALPGDEVVLADGLYTGPGNKYLDFRGKPITVRSAAGDPASCIIDCESQGCGFFFHYLETAESVVHGLTICNGNSYYAGGVHCRYSSPTLSHCALLRNIGGFGGGIYCEASSPSLTSCSITQNTAYQYYGGGGVCCQNSSPTLTHCRIENNAAHSGGGLFYEGRCPTLTNCTISGNSAQRDGGGIYFAGCSTPVPMLTNCTITANVAQGCGGGVFCSSPGPILTNCIAWANVPDQIYVYSGTGPTVTYCDIQGGWTGAGNIDVDPAFAFATDAHLLPGSPCIDSGTNDPPGGLPAGDIEAQPRLLDGDDNGQAVADMGAYEFNPAVPAIALSAAGLTFFVPAGQSGSQTLGVRNASLGNLAWQLDWAVDWLTADPGTGESSGETDPVTLTVDTQALPRGRYYATLWVSDPQAGNSPRPVWLVLYVNAALGVPGEFPTIQAAIDSAIPGDEVVLADGVYAGPGNRDLDFCGKAITVRSASGEPAACIIDCERQGRGLYFHSGETRASGVHGLTICNGYEFQGGGVCCKNSGPTLSDCVIIGNTASDGGGISCSSAGAVLVNCVIKANTADECGGGVYGGGDGLTYVNCIIAANVAGDSGGGMYCYAEPVLTNCTIAGNSAANQGGGIYCGDSAGPVLTNCVLWADAPEEIYAVDASPVVAFCDVQGGWTGTGNISVNPLFAFPGDYHLWPDSPCLDAGTNDPPGGLWAEDIEGQSRPVDGDNDGHALADMGAYEADPATPTIALSATDFSLFVPRDDSASRSLRIRNCGEGTLAWELGWEPEWISADTTSGESSGQASTVTLSVNTQGLEPGRHLAVLWVTDPRASNSPRPVSVLLYVNDLLHVPGQYATIQAAIDAALPGDAVVLADGAYTGPGNKELDFCGKAITVRSAGGDPATCIIDCEYDGYGFWFHNGESVTSVVQGLTICHGAIGGVQCSSSNPLLVDCTIRDCTAAGGGAVYCSSCAPTLTNCTLSGNTATGERGGGGLYCLSASPILNDCTIVGNLSSGEYGAGGGVRCEFYSSPTLTNCTISGNIASGCDGGGGVLCWYWCNPRLINCAIIGNVSGNDGGGIYCDWESYPTLIDCAISDNAASSGGGLYCGSSDVTLTNCTIIANTATYGGGLYGTWSNATLSNCTVVANTATYGGGLYGGWYDCRLRNCILWDNAAEQIHGSGAILAFCDIQGGWTGTGNIDSAPLFLDPDGPDDDPATWEDNDLRLRSDSPCIDAGDPDFVPQPGEVDPDGHLRLWDGDADGLTRIDMGAYEFDSHAAGDLNCDDSINGFDIDPFVLALTSPTLYAGTFPDCEQMLADLNGDGLVNAFDIDPFVLRLIGG